jgi:hypothetical protein
VGPQGQRPEEVPSLRVLSLEGQRGDSSVTEEDTVSRILSLLDKRDRDLEALRKDLDRLAQHVRRTVLGRE